MKRLISVVVVTLLLQATVTAAAPQGKHGKHARPERVRHDDRAHARVVDVHVAFGAADITVIRNHYGPRHRNLPPGLRKKLARGGQLPPGWQRKFEPFPVVVERRLAHLSPDYGRGVIDGHAVIFNRRSNVIVDVAVLF